MQMRSWLRFLQFHLSVVNTVRLRLVSTTDPPIPYPGFLLRVIFQNLPKSYNFFFWCHFWSFSMWYTILSCFFHIFFIVHCHFMLFIVVSCHFFSCHDIYCLVLSFVATYCHSRCVLSFLVIFYVFISTSTGRSDHWLLAVLSCFLAPHSQFFICCNYLSFFVGSCPFLLSLVISSCVSSFLVTECHVLSSLFLSSMLMSSLAMVLPI